MKLKKIALCATSMLLFGTVMPSLSNTFGTSPIIVVNAQEDQEALLQRIRTSLLENEPINEEQLEKVSQEDLLTFYDDASFDNTWKDMFFAIAEKYSELNLITDETTYNQFQEAYQVALKHSGKEAAFFVNVDPIEFLTTFQTIKEAYPEDEATAISEFVKTFGEGWPYKAEAETDVATETTDENTSTTVDLVTDENSADSTTLETVTEVTSELLSTNEATQEQAVESSSVSESIDQTEVSLAPNEESSLTETTMNDTTSQSDSTVATTIATTEVNETTATTSTATSTVNVVTSNGVETSNQALLPNTGENTPTILVLILALLLGCAGVFVLKKQKSE